MNAPIVKFNIKDLSFSVANVLKGISGVQGITLRRPHAKPDLLITTWNQFVATYGGYISNSDFPLLCKRAFDRGVQLRVSRVGHYTDVTDPSTLDAVLGTWVKAKTLTFSAALVTSNQVDMTINGTPITPVTFATDSDTTMAAVATAIKAVTTYVEDAFVVTLTGGSSNDRVIVVLPKTTTLSITGLAVTLGASQATITQANINNIPSTTGVGLFSWSPKWKGEDYNNLKLTISAASNGNTSYFDMTISHINDSSLTETYQNLNMLQQKVNF
mgnify:FL=1